VRNPRAEARARVGGRFDVRVLEPSPPAVAEPPFFADDPVAGGEVVPVERPGSRSWADLCRDEDDTAFLEWCRDRWLVRKPLMALPEGFAASRASLHALAEHVLAPARHAATGKIGLRFTHHGFGTPFFAHSRAGVEARQVRVHDDALVDGEKRHPLTTLADASALLGIPVGARTGVYEPTTAGDPDAPLAVDRSAARALADWFGFCASVLEQVRADATGSDAPGRVQLWPEHFDISVDLGPAGSRANFGGSPGDGQHPEPYLYVAPFDGRKGAFWNEPFGASVSYSQLRGGADALEFMRRGQKLLR
jgi:hypothetical protein